MSQNSSTSPPADERQPLHHPNAFEPATLVVTILLSVIGAYIGLHLVTSLGISANTSVIGALIAMLIARVGVLGLGKFRDIHRQNLAQTAISGATFAAANALLTPIAIPFVFGRSDLIWAMLIGVAVGLGIDSFVLFKAFGSRFLPATAAWPPGVAAAETIKAGDQGGRRAKVLLGSGVLGVVLSLFGLSGSAAGVAFIGNVVALLMLGIGLLVSENINLIPALSDFSLADNYIPHGIMVGAGVVALIQAVIIFFSRKEKKREAAAEAAAEAVTEAKGSAPAGPDPADVPSRSPQQLGGALGGGFVLFMAGALLLALISGITADLSVGALIGWVIFAAFAALVHEIIVGLAAMHSGWFPAFAVTLIFLVIGIVIGLPEVPLVVLVGYCAATGPAFADMGYDLKAGWLLRKINSRHPDYRSYEMSGRRQQYYSSIVGFAVALAMVALLWKPFFENGQIPPVSKVFADTISAGLTNPDAVQNLILWAIPGALIQALGGSTRQMGVMLATGLLLDQPYACWLIFAALIIRLVVRHTKGAKAEDDLSLVGAGLIAGDAIGSMGQIFKPK